MEVKYLRGVDEKNNDYDDSIIIKRYSSNFKGVMAQFMMAAAIFILIAGSRMTINYGMILPLHEMNETLHVTSETGRNTEHLIVIVYGLAIAIGALVSGPLNDYIGRRGCLQFASISLFLGWIVPGFSKYYIAQACLGSILLGFAAGLTDAPAKVILAEMSDPRLRGMFLGGTGLAYLAGNCFFHYLYSAVEWETLALYVTIPSILGHAALWLVHESPAWLMRQKKGEAARKALLWLRGGDKAQVNREVDILEARVNSDLPWYFNPAVMKPLIIIIVLNVLYHLSGAHFLFENYIIILQENTFDYKLTVMNIVLFPGALVLFLMVGRRTLGLLSALGTGFISLLLACHLFFGKEVANDGIYIYVGLSIYLLASTVDFMFLHGTVVVELLPHTVGGLGVGFIFFLLNLIHAVCLFLQLLVRSLIGKVGSLLICGAFAFINVIFIYFFLPETKDKTLQEIEDYFQEENIVYMSRKKRA